MCGSYRENQVSTLPLWISLNWSQSCSNPRPFAAWARKRSIFLVTFVNTPPYQVLPILPQICQFPSNTTATILFQATLAPLLDCCNRLIAGFPTSSLIPATTKITPIKHKSYLVAPLLPTLQKPLDAPRRLSKILNWVDSVLAIYSSLSASSSDLSAFRVPDSFSPLGLRLCYSLCLKHLFPLFFTYWVYSVSVCGVQGGVWHCPHNV